ncbi:hypothetical protein GE09DRAFT_1232897 [Coniochaeta sp. 2T2.1]|nr:hypothetical protein GE09DRAFT_1232897 [Coniochaeta sp. 2T2.1]
MASLLRSIHLEDCLRYNARRSTYRIEHRLVIKSARSCVRDAVILSEGELIGFAEEWDALSFNEDFLPDNHCVQQLLHARVGRADLGSSTSVVAHSDDDEALGRRTSHGVVVAELTDARNAQMEGHDDLGIRERGRTAPEDWNRVLYLVIDFLYRRYKNKHAVVTTNKARDTKLTAPRFIKTEKDKKDSQTEVTEKRRLFDKVNTTRNTILNIRKAIDATDTIDPEDDEAFLATDELHAILLYVLAREVNMAHHLKERAKKEGFRLPEHIQDKGLLLNAAEPAVDAITEEVIEEAAKEVADLDPQAQASPSSTPPADVGEEQEDQPINLTIEEVSKQESQAQASTSATKPPRVDKEEQEDQRIARAVELRVT